MLLMKQVRSRFTKYALHIEQKLAQNFASEFSIAIEKWNEMKTKKKSEQKIFRPDCNLKAFYN